MSLTHQFILSGGKFCREAFECWKSSVSCCLPINRVSQSKRSARPVPRRSREAVFRCGIRRLHADHPRVLVGPSHHPCLSLCDHKSNLRPSQTCCRLSCCRFYCRANNAKLRVQQRMIQDGIKNKVVYEGTVLDPHKPQAERPSGPSWPEGLEDKNGLTIPFFTWKGWLQLHGLWKEVKHCMFNVLFLFVFDEQLQDTANQKHWIFYSRSPTVR